ncbi:MAG: molecular chaperone DnaJ [Bacillota bacterium]
MSKRDYYEVLGLSRDATEADIKKAYRKLARQYHPDVNSEDKSAEEKFKEVKDAYEVLSDADKRASYDHYGHAGTDNNGQGGFGNAGADFGGFGDIFDMFFGGGAGAQKRGPQKGNDIRYNMEMAFEEAAFGLESDIKVPRTESCPTCSGSGSEPGTHPTTCPGCKGNGEVRVTQSTPFGHFQTIKPCQQCHGEGKIINTPCKECRGQGRVRRVRTIHVKIPAGVDSDSRLRVTGEGESGIRGGPPGDLYVFIDVKPHRFFERQGSDVYCEMPVSFAQAALGDEIPVATLDGDVKLKIPEGTQTGTMFRLKGKGIPRLRGFGRGDQHVKVKVVTPTTLTEKQKALLKQFEEPLMAENNDKERTDKDKGFFDKVKDAFMG